MRLPPRTQPDAADDPRPPTARLHPWRHGWRAEVLVLALALLAIAVFAIGYGIGLSDETFRTSWYSSLDGTRVSPLAVGTVQGGPVDDAGNTPLLLTVRGLRLLESGERYVLYVVRSRRPATRAGSFTVGEGTTQVRLSYPGLRVEPRGWLVAREGRTAGEIGPILLRTR